MNEATHIRRLLVVLRISFPSQHPDPTPSDQALRHAKKSSQFTGHKMKGSILLSALTLVSTILALPTPAENGARLLQVRDVLSVFEERQSCYETCGTVCYYQSTINTAVSNGYSLYQSGEEEGSSTYPHTYNNYEGFDFPVSGPYQEYPVMNNFKPYNGGSPGADRVIFNTQGQYAGTVTHTGASGNDFVACDGS